jgi:hypothetical protein
MEEVQAPVLVPMEVVEAPVLAPVPGSPAYSDIQRDLAYAELVENLEIDQLILPEAPTHGLKDFPSNVHLRDDDDNSSDDEDEDSDYEERKAKYRATPTRKTLKSCTVSKKPKNVSIVPRKNRKKSANDMCVSIRSVFGESTAPSIEKQTVAQTLLHERCLTISLDELEALLKTGNKFVQDRYDTIRNTVLVMDSNEQNASEFRNSYVELKSLTRADLEKRIEYYQTYVKIAENILANEGPDTVAVEFFVKCIDHIIKKRQVTNSVSVMKNSIFDA